MKRFLRHRSASTLRAVSRAGLLKSGLSLALAVFLCGSAVFARAQQQSPEPPAEQQRDPQSEVRPRRVAPLPAQSDSSAPIDRDTGDDVIRVDTDLVLIDVAVNDASGRPVRGLKPSDFKIYEDGVERPVSFLNTQRRADLARPLAVVFALDVSGSMTTDELLRLREALRAFVDRLHARPTLTAMMSFGMNVNLLHSLTNDRRKMERAFDKLLSDANGLSTHAYDAVDDAVRLLARKAPPTIQGRSVKRSVVVITDGFPVGDTVSPATVIERAKAADVSVYTVTLPSYSRIIVSTDRAPLPTPLDVSGLAEQTGGRNVFAIGKDYEPLFTALAEEVASSYVLAFYPSEENRRDGRFHNVRVEAPQGLRVSQSQPGYAGQKPREK